MTDNIADSEGRQSGEFTEEEAKVHHAGFKIIFEGMQRGLSFDDACAGLKVVDPVMRQIIVDDYLKVTIAEQHFEAKRDLKDVALDLSIPLERVEAAKGQMMAEVEKAAIDHYHKTSSDAGPEAAAGEDQKKKDN
jgi:hypothetical protein